MVTENLWGERWSKLVTNVMGNGLSACTGMISPRHDQERRDPPFLEPGSAARRSASARRSATISRKSATWTRRPSRAPAKAIAAAHKEIDEHRLAEASRPGGGEHRPSMGQDMVKGRRTEIEFLNGFVVKKGEEVGIAAPTNAILTDIVNRVERGELKPDPSTSPICG